MFFLFGSDGGFDCLGVVLLDVAFSQHWPAHVVAALMALSQADLTGYPQMACIHFMASLVDGRL